MFVRLLIDCYNLDWSHSCHCPGGVTQPRNFQLLDNNMDTDYYLTTVGSSGDLAIVDEETV